ncbi:hypothetical protein [Mesorhizobium sp. WSM3859]|uniref:hypothetical protein n=1 Tax=Mesorhizobium sp. WSM3859 TaxID=2029402 RepID=UPI001140C623|nr:hypothetical protein [Mesorhizobium sp. WSM3859]
MSINDLPRGDGLTRHDSTRYSFMIPVSPMWRSCEIKFDAKTHKSMEVRGGAAYQSMGGATSLEIALGKEYPFSEVTLGGKLGAGTGLSVYCPGCQRRAVSPRRRAGQAVRAGSALLSLGSAEDHPLQRMPRAPAVTIEISSSPTMP